MKKVACIVIAVALIAVVFALGYLIFTRETETIHPASFGISVTNHSSSELYGIQFVYDLGEQALGSGMVSPAGGKDTIPIGDALTWTDFGEIPEGAEVLVECFVVLEDQVPLSCGEPLRLRKETGKQYTYYLIGSSADGFALLPQEAFAS